MAWRRPQGMEEYLKPTELCDCDDLRLKEKAEEIIEGSESAKEAALKIFGFVREEIPFGLDYPDAKASHTLRKRVGFCFSKTNLQMALLRAVGIPARCHYVHVPKQLLKEFTPSIMYRRLPMVAGHPLCECYLSGKWIACEALLDEALYKANLRMGFFTKEVIPTIDWDGETSLALLKPQIAKDVGTFASLDEVMAEARKRGDGMPPSNRLFGWFVFFLGNRRINEMRKG